MKKLYGSIRFFHRCIGTIDDVMNILVRNTLCFNLAKLLSILE